MTDATIIARINMLYQQESRRVYATLVRLLGDMDLAEDMLQEAFQAALQQWVTDGIPQNPRAWLVSTGRFKGIDQIRRRARLSDLQEKAAPLDTLEPAAAEGSASIVDDDRLRLIFTCCHPALAPELQVALTLREVCGLTTEAIARAFLVAPTALAQRLVRGKAKIRQAGIPYELPSTRDLPERLDSVLQVIYLVFNEGHQTPEESADITVKATPYHSTPDNDTSDNSTPDRTPEYTPDLRQEAIRLGYLVVELLPDPEALGLVALMLLHEARRTSRWSAEGDIILLQHQDRRQWDATLIAEAQALLNQAFAGGEVGSYVLEAGIAAEHARAAEFAATDWPRIVTLYEWLLRANPSPVVALNHAVAIAMRDGPQAGLERIERLLEDKSLQRYHLAYAARADLHQQCGQLTEAQQDYRRALNLAKSEPERRFLQQRLAQLAR